VTLSVATALLSIEIADATPVTSGNYSRVWGGVFEFAGVGEMRREEGSTNGGQSLSAAELELMNAWWRAANYLSVGQIYLLDNPLLDRPLERANIKPRLLGHWGTTPGLNFIYVHLNRVIKARDLDKSDRTGVEGRDRWPGSRRAPGGARADVARPRRL
jgi:XFP N-terminal domain